MTATVPDLAVQLDDNLPVASSPRFKPLRAGIRNVWEYDDQEFWFADGRLLLRGQNTAGKSKALELLFPFVLDGDTRSERLDPFGSKSKTMYWNLIDFDDRATAIGYCWAEFGRVDEGGDATYVTCIVGMRAARSAGRKVDTWFAVTPARIGRDIELAPDDYPITADKLRDILPDASLFTRTAREHRGAVDTELFGLGPERYDALLHLLRQLRRPKLSEKLDMASLGDYLADALPPLNQQRIEVLARAFGRLDDEASELETLEASLSEVESFMDPYTEHAKLLTRLRCDAVRSAASKLDAVTATERVQREHKDTANSELDEIEKSLRSLAEQIEQLEGALAGLDMSKVHALDEVRRRATEARGYADTLIQVRDRDRDAAKRSGDTAERTAADAAEAATSYAGHDIECAIAATNARLDTLHGAQREQFRTNPEGAALALDEAATRRFDLLNAVRGAAKQASKAEDKIRVARIARDDAEAEAESARNTLELSEASAERSEGDFTDALIDWARSTTIELAASYPDDAIASVHAGNDEFPTEIFDRAQSELFEARAEIRATIRATESRRNELADKLTEVESETADAPQPTAGRPGRRPDGSAPLWACVDFAPDLDETQRANLEAALEAAGLLDALITPSGDVLAAETLDTWLVPGAGEPGDWLIPDPHAPIDRESVTGALAALAGAEADGTWSGTGLAGRWTKPEAEFIGAAARAAARERRIANLVERIAALDTELGELGAADTDFVAAERKLAHDRENFPSSQALRIALHDAERAQLESSRRCEVATRAATRLSDVQQRAAAIFETLAVAEIAAECRVDQLEDATLALGLYRRRLIDLRSASEKSNRLAKLAIEASDDEQRLDAIAAESTRQADTADQSAVRARGEADELFRTSGADIETIVDRKTELTAQRHGARSEQRDCSTARDDARERLTRAETLLAQTEAARSDAETRRGETLTALSQIAATELVALAGCAVEPDTDLTAVTAGLMFARAAHATLAEITVDQAARDRVSNRLHRSFSTLRSQLGASFDPYLDTTDGIELCSATLNGKPAGIAELATSLEDQVERRRSTLTDAERELIEKHLLNEVGAHLGERVHAGWTLVKRMNDQLKAHPTRGGVTLRLDWEPAPDADTAALRLLQSDVSILDDKQRSTLASFLQERVRIARDDAEGHDAVERLANALDYRRWHRFAITRITTDGKSQRLTARTQGTGSGGEQAKLAHLPLFAATAAYYMSAAPSAPHLLMLDEAFAGIDDDQKADCMAMLVDLDLDVILTNYAEFGCYPEVPALAIYHLERTPGTLGVTALRFVWDGSSRRENDPFLDRQDAPPDTGLFM